MYKSGHLQGGCPYYASHFKNAQTDLLHLGAMSAHVFAEQRQECNNMYIINKLCKPKTSARLDKQREQVFHEQRTQSFGKVLSLKGFHHSYSSSGLGNTKMAGGETLADYRWSRQPSPTPGMRSQNHTLLFSRPSRVAKQRAMATLEEELDQEILHNEGRDTIVTISAATGSEGGQTKLSVGKSGVEYHYHTEAEYQRVTDEQKLDLKRWRQFSCAKNGGGKR